MLALPVGRGYLEAAAGVSNDAGPFARVEAGLHPLAPVGLFGFAAWSPSSSSAGVGARVAF